MATEATICAVCFYSVTWQRTSSSKSDQMHHMHHCRSCGSVVCEPCSSKKMALPAYGIVSEVRVCDSCYWQGFKLAI